MTKHKEKKAAVFIVDDDEAIRRSLQLLLKTLGLPSIVCASTAEFLASCDPAQPGCVLLDVRMLGMSGLELQQELNRRGAIIPDIHHRPWRCSHGG